MTTTPAGVAPWVRSVGIADYGGNAEKTDYLGIGVVNPKTDVSAAQFLRLTNDLAAAVRTAELCTIMFTCRDSGTPDDPLVTYVGGMVWLYSSSGGYDGGAPPSGYPGVTRVSDGRVRVVFASSYTDSYGVSGSVVIHGAVPGAVAAGIAANPVKQSALVWDVALVTRATGAAVQDQSGVVTFW